MCSGCPLCRGSITTAARLSISLQHRTTLHDVSAKIGFALIWQRFIVILSVHIYSISQIHTASDCTLSLSLVTLARPPTSSSLRITDRSFDIPHLISGINSLLLSVNLIPVPLFLTCLFMLLSHLLTLSTHHPHRQWLPLSVSIPAQNLPVSRIFHTIDDRLSSGIRIDATGFMTGPFLLNISVLYGRPM